MNYPYVSPTYSICPLCTNRHSDVQLKNHHGALFRCRACANLYFSELHNATIYSRPIVYKHPASAPLICLN